ncbi:malonyl-CoA decarboxylase [Roseovarius nanhaiticus]|uniref:Malonyl-CoA decarboxylase n=1 Tax=Roseovarius nanhaiticus TaxID=573024 RepID=A0A1N7GGK0_9RHOB|nr:malonyl-CoA decarboxylase [Roseovarius nanhaiticus]SEK26656.1 malonyl-CoA decarboxylase [Roseovarius nanhaiticus]SIS11711.1 malonyl-CoA decarboxylase [Roseovarius nanhaiticus]
MTVLSDLLASVFERGAGAARRGDWSRRPLAELADALVTTHGEMSGTILAEQILSRFAAMDDAAKLAFFRHLSDAMNVDPAAARAALDEYEAAPSRQSYRGFMAAAEPPRQELIRRLNRVPGATGALVAMRADLLRLGRGVPELEALDLDFRHLFASWFNRGFLVLRRITWDTPAQILEKIIAYEAVHAIDSWDDLRRRVQPEDRRCFAFFHPAMPDEPLIFVEVALTRGIPGAVQPLLAETREALKAANADTAVFYSISNCQSGLAGISFGNSLIKQVAGDLAAELTNLTRFVTLSPIPGFMKWAEAEGITTNEADLPAFAAYYLMHAKGRGDLPRDPVARFHLGNGAIIHALHGQADLSQKGLAQSGGVMVNYLYDLRRTAERHEAFAGTGAVAVTSAVKSLAATAETKMNKGA